MPNFKHGQVSFSRGKIHLPGVADLQSVINDIAFSSQVKMVRDALGEEGVRKFLKETEKRSGLPSGTLKKWQGETGK